MSSLMFCTRNTFRPGPGAYANNNNNNASRKQGRNQRRVQNMPDQTQGVDLLSTVVINMQLRIQPEHCEKLRFQIVSEDPGLYRKHWESFGKKSHYVSFKSELVVLIYDKETENDNAYTTNGYFHVIV